jgi:hypothetical protein
VLNAYREVSRHLCAVRDIMSVSSAADGPKRRDKPRFPVPFFNWWYRRRLWTFRYLEWRDVLPVIQAMLAVGLAVNGYSTRPVLSVVLGGSYACAALIYFSLGLRARRALDHGQGEVIWTLFACMNEQLFMGDHRTRFTLFIPAPGRPDYIIPWYRYRDKGSGPILEAQRSCARYRRGEGETGKAWDQAGRVLIRTFPAFQTRQEFKGHYIDVLKVDPAVVDDLSDYMIGVQTILSYGFVGNNRRLLGVLSLDLQAPMSKTVEGRHFFPTPEGDGQTELDWSRMELLLRSVQMVLETFASGKTPEVHI